MSPGKRPPKNPSALRMVGELLALFRKAAGHTQATLAARLVISEATIAAYEQGRRPLPLDTAGLMDQVLETKGALAVTVANMPEIDQFPLYAEQYMAHEQEAIALSWYDMAVVPGLLQTPDYARALFRQRVPAYDTDEFETKVSARIDRQDILHRKYPPTLSCIVWEPALRMAFVEPAVRAAQLGHLRECADLPGLSLQVIALDAEENAGDSGPFTLLETPEHQHLAYTESQRGSQWVSDPDEVSILQRKYAMLRSQALSPQDTKGLLDRLTGEQ
ncbi:MULTISPECIES: helix-turn-helix transcriptional regulator [unclassified Streptomyces]|uniref:helix-turn-helix domain-containing protein n=1 Tax=unclassified Streptomyces TaxID=2593676 RepID=UPI000DBA428D|nr:MULTISPECIES: helix-turn-helix transcriptional regulator [unclassified Streptomyces]MYT74006.1 helix-turn-helix domain-containing protein [Streptomyces sp. SID8367]RAJ89422.1 transcriptional regulator with XRE-family HTH domain [Streptomyces sp. PsTaAH-137]